MQFPWSPYLNRPTVMLKVPKREPQDRYRKGLRQLSLTNIGVSDVLQLKMMLGKSALDRLA